MRVLYIDIDTLRPDHMSCYGYPRNTTPCLDEIAREGMRFSHVYCSDAPCLPSRAALISGMFGIRNGAVGHGGTAADRRNTGEKRDFQDAIDRGNFNNIFRKAGMHTCSISTFAERHSSYWYTAGFHETVNVGEGGGETGEKVVNEALDWLSRKGEKDSWYLHVHLWDPHTPYRAPSSFGNPFEKAPYPNWITEDILQNHLSMSSPHGANEIGMFTDQIPPQFPRMPGSIRKIDEMRKLFDGYDCGVRYADMQVGRVLDALKALGVWEDTAIIVTSDHGENLGELGLYAEHATADEPTCHIPLLVKFPGGQKGKVDAGFHYLLDLAPTLADLLHVEKNPEWDGLSFADTVLSGKEEGRDVLILSQMAHVCQRSARFDNYVYIRTIHDGFHLFDDEMLFDVEKDPHELHNLRDEQPEKCEKGARLILNWQEQEMKKSFWAEDPMWRVMREGGPYHARGFLSDYLKRLYATGRTAQADRLKARHISDR